MNMAKFQYDGENIGFSRHGKNAIIRDTWSINSRELAFRADAPTAKDFDMTTLSDSDFSTNVTLERIVAVGTKGVSLKGFNHTVRKSSIDSMLYIPRDYQGFTLATGGAIESTLGGYLS